MDLVLAFAATVTDAAVLVSLKGLYAQQDSQASPFAIAALLQLAEACILGGRLCFVSRCGDDWSGGSGPPPASRTDVLVVLTVGMLRALGALLLVVGVFSLEAGETLGGPTVRAPWY